jgi:hypothetical protein
MKTFEEFNPFKNKFLDIKLYRDDNKKKNIAPYPGTVDPYGEEDWDDDLPIEYVDSDDIKFIEEKIQTGEYIFVKEKLVVLRIWQEQQRRVGIGGTICKVHSITKEEYNREKTKDKFLVFRELSGIVLSSPVYGFLVGTGIHARGIRGQWEDKRLRYLELERTINAIHDNQI